MTSSRKHAQDLLHSVHIQETNLCQTQHAYVRKQGLSAEQDETDVSWVWTNVFFFFRERGFSEVDCRGWLPHIPPVQWGKTEVEWDMFGIEWGRSGEGLSETDVTPSLSSPCLNKSCSRSFYLHMLTGTSEFPEERCKEKKTEKKPLKWNTES